MAIKVNAALPQPGSYQDVQGVSGYLATLYAALLGNLSQISAAVNKHPLMDEVTVAKLPDAGSNRGRMVFVADEAGGAVPAFSDGTDWRRVTDRAIVS